MFRLLAFSFLILNFGFLQAQDIGLHFGHQMYGVFNAKKQLHGISIGLDIPRSGFITPYGQFTLFTPYRNFENSIGNGVPKNPSDPFLFDVPARSKTMTYSLELGTIYYLGGAYDYGFSGMIHNSMRILLMPTKIELIDFDFDKYEFQPIDPNASLANSTGFVLNTSFGAGLKYTFEWGSVYALANIELALFGDRIPGYYFDESGRVSPLSFSTRLGIRRDLDFAKNSERKQVRENNRKERKKW